MDDAGDELWRERLRQVVSSHGGRSTVARLSGVPLQTLKNHLDGRTQKVLLEDLKKIAAACGRPAAWLAGVDDGAAQAGLRETEVTAYAGPPPSWPLKPPSGRLWYVVRNRALDLAGILPGDIVEFDTQARPTPGEPVVVQLYDDDTGSAETVIRLYRPPYLVTHSGDPAVDATPLPVDPPGRARIAGAFVALVRTRRT